MEASSFYNRCFECKYQIEDLHGIYSIFENKKRIPNKSGDVAATEGGEVVHHKHTGNVKCWNPAAMYLLIIGEVARILDGVNP